MARISVRHLAAVDPATEVPPEDMLPYHYRRIAPYLYSPGEITALMAAAGRLTPPLRAATWQTLISLLAVTGLFSRDHRPWRKSGLRVCAAQRLMERR